MRRALTHLEALPTLARVQSVNALELQRALVARFCMSRWYLVHTKPSGESLAQANLERQGYEIYLPRVIRSTRHRGRWQERIVALFPRYLFLALKEGLQSLAPVRSSSGVKEVVRFGGRYAHVPDQVVLGLLAREDSVTRLHRLNKVVPLLAGTLVKVTEGPFDGLQGIFDREEGVDRVVILLRLLGCEAAVELPAGCVLPGQAA